MSNIGQVVDSLKQIREDPRKGLPTGLSELDERINGLIPGELTLVGGFSSSGKSSFLVQLVCNWIDRYKIDVYTLELSREIFLNRMLCNLGSLPFYPLIDNELDEEQEQVADELMQNICSYPINLYKMSWVTPQKILKQMQKTQPDVVIIDRLGFLNWPDKNIADYKQKEMICKELQYMSEQCEIPIIVAAQMTMSSEEAHRNGGEMALSEFRGAKAIKDYSRCCLGINRPGYYVNKPEDTRAYIEIMKKTNGMTGRVECRYIGEHFKFVDRESESICREGSCPSMHKRFKQDELNFMGSL